MKNWERIALSMAIVSAVGCGCPAFSQPNALPTAEKLSEIVRKTQVIKADTPLQIAIEGKQARITTLRSPKATEQDCKIDAVLLAKAVFENFPDKLTRVKTQFGSTEDNALHQVTVTAGDVKAYGNGSITENELLSSLEFVNVMSDSKPESSRIGVKPGPLENERALLSMHIERLQSRGTNTAGFQKLFNQLEDALKTEDHDTLEKRIKDLRQKLWEQDQLVKQADNISDGVASRQTTLRHLWGNSPLVEGLSKMHRQPGQAGDQNPSASPAGGSQRFGALIGLYKPLKIKRKITAMKEQGQNVSGFEKTFDDAEHLWLNGNKEEANSMLQDLARRLGVE